MAPKSIPVVALATILCCALLLIGGTASSLDDVPSSAAAIPTVPHRSFRCFRPFSALDKFSPSSMHRKDNCEFHFVTIDKATVTTQCDRQAPDDDSAQQGDNGVSCYATLDITMHTTPNLLWHQELPADKSSDVENGQRRPHYHPYYTVEIHALNHSRITYKGFDGLGYDLCCDFLNRSSAECDWEEPEHVTAGDETAPVAKRRILKYCAVTDRNLHREARMVVAGSVRKPLHRLIAGDWELKWTLRRGQETVGRLVIPFHVSEDQLRGVDESSLHDDSHVRSEALSTTTSMVSVKAEVEETDSTKPLSDVHVLEPQIDL